MRIRRYLLTEKLASSFSSPHELATLVLAAVAKYQDAIKKTDDASRQKTEMRPAITWDINKDGSPFPGMMHFTRKYAPVFFGREAEVREVLDRLRLPEGRFLIISGGSGTGKSSLVDAGVLPKVEESGIGEERRYVCVRMVPSEGNHPFDALLRPLHDYAKRGGLNVYELAEKMAAEPNILPEKIHEIISKGMDGDGLILFLDQMEELFTSQNPEVSNKFLSALYEAAQKGSLRVLATIRSDHLHLCHAHPEMLQILRGPAGHYPLGPVEPFMLSDMIVKPAECAGLRVHETLARQIVSDTGTGPGSLPLLAFVLNQLFEKRTDHELSEAVYKTLGGVTGAIAQHAESVESKIRNELGGKTFEILPRVFESLVIVKEEGLPTRRRPLLSDFEPEIGKLLDALVLGRLLHTEGEGNTATLSLSHEKLFDAWPSLRVYVETNKKRLMDQTLLESRARKWVDMGKPWFGGLASGWERREFRRSGAISRLSREHLKASRRAQWIRIGGIVLPLALFVGIGAWLWKEDVTVRYAGSIVLARLELVDVHEPKMVPIPGEPFAIGRYEVTFAEYDKYAELTGERLPPDEDWGRGNRPVIYVSWDNALAYAGWLSRATGKTYRLPTDKEWQYAASSGKDEVWAGMSDEKLLGDYAVYAGNSKGRTAPVGSKKPNGLGLHDMIGNVWEWVQDCEPKVEEDYCVRRVMRGGSRGSGPGGLRSSFRSSLEAADRFSDIGFRLAQDIE
jgi:Sulfatase-modifying factor enzyme 1/AAA ATPase domain